MKLKECLEGLVKVFNLYQNAIKNKGTNEDYNADTEELNMLIN